MDGTAHLSVFGQNAQSDLSEFGWDGDWTAGPARPGAAPKTRPYAMQWFSPQGSVTSVFYQDSRNTLREQRAAGGQWAPGPFVVPGAAPGSGIAVVSWADGGGVHMRAYYQDAQNTIREQCFDGGWQPGHEFTAPAAAPGTGLAAACWTDAGTGAIHLRVYYQDSQDTIGEQSAGSGQWQAGYLAAAAPGSGLAAARWLDAAGRGHVRVYYQDPENVIREQCYDSGAWVRGQFVGPAR